MDVSIEYRLGGRKVSRDEFFDGLESRICASTVERARTRLRRVRCPRHGRHAGVQELRMTPDGFELKLAGCCDELLELARRALR